jgi:CheY-like chemotaxis protein
MKKKSILLIEDDEWDLISFKRTVEKLDIQFELYTAFNGKDALGMLTSRDAITPDIILLDLSIPKMDGIEFLEALRSHPQLKTLNIFVMTTSSDTLDRTEIEQYGISGYFIKPLNYNNNTKKNDSMEGFVQFHLRRILAGE